MKTLPWHSTQSPAYHTETECLRGNRVKGKNRRPGTGGNYHCHWCKKLERRRVVQRKATLST